MTVRFPVSQLSSLNPQLNKAALRLTVNPFGSQARHFPYISIGMATPGKTLLLCPIASQPTSKLSKLFAFHSACTNFDNIGSVSAKQFQTSLIVLHSTFAIFVHSSVLLRLICGYNVVPIMKAMDINKETENKVAYIIAVINEFASTHSLNNAQAYRYLERFKGLDFVNRFYNVKHTFSFEDVVNDLTAYCHRKGGALV